MYKTLYISNKIVNYSITAANSDIVPTQLIALNLAISQVTGTIMQ